MPTHASLRFRQVHLDFHTSPAIPGVGRGGAGEELTEDEARLLYVAMTRATRELVMVGA